MGLQDRCQVIQNTQRSFKMAKLYKAYHLCPDEAIVVELDGDDWLPNNNILSLINKTYCEHDVWMTYGHYLDWPKNISTESIPHIIKTKIEQSMI